MTPPDRAGWNLDEAFMRIVARRFGLHLQSATPVDQGGAVNHVERMVTDSGEVIVRVQPPGLGSGDRLGAIHAVQRHLQACGLPVPSLLRTTTGETWIEVEDRLVEVMYYVPDGHQVSSWADAGVLFHGLGTLHHALRAIDPASLPPPDRLWHHPPAASLAMLDESESAFRSMANRQHWEAAARIRDMTRTVLTRLAAAWPAYADAVPLTTIHGDFVGNNVQVAGERLVAIIDFDRMAVGTWIYEVAYALQGVLSRLSFISRRPPAGDGLSEDDIVRARNLIGVYEKASGWSLERVEWLALPFEMARVPLYPVVTAALDPDSAVRETLIFANSVRFAAWLSERAQDVTAALASP